MAGRVTVLTPQHQSDAIELGRHTFRKQILPVGSLNYAGRKLKFTRRYLDDLVAAFKARAFDACPLQLADASNAHTNEPDRAAGEVIGLEATDEGLYATVSATDKGAEILREHPNLGVSVRIVEDLERQDGAGTQRHPAALQHVLATWAPRIAGMQPWAAVECSQETDEVIDLSTLTFTPDGEPATPEPPTVAAPGWQGNTKEPTTVAPQLTDEELAAVRAIFPVFQKLAEPDKPAEMSATDATPASVTELPAKSAVKIEAPTDVEVDADVDEAIAVSQPDTDNAVELAQVAMRSQMDLMAVELAEVRSREDSARWKYESEQLVRDYGIPPAIVALAEPLLKGSKHVVELAQGASVDAGQVLRDVLHQVATVYGRRIDLSGPVGSAREVAAEDQAKAERDRIHASAHAAGFGK